MKSFKKLSQQKRIELAVTTCQNNSKKLSIRKIARQYELNKFTLRERLKDCKSRQTIHIKR